ncbi:DUF192 domain-containing protein [Streptomyces sp. NPDC088745]|uniref:DUF192 domain-containing protein n=1 Tax=Streptomyces sp. NPDC088745 TaxID=3365884 RepID=UPI003815DE43
MGRQERQGRYEDGHGALHIDGVPAPVPLEIATSAHARSRGLLGRTGIEGALLLTPASGIHTFRMRFPLEVAYLDRDLRVLAVRLAPPNRLPLPPLRTRHVLEAEAGALTGWGVRAGTRVRVADATAPRRE